MTNLEIFIRRLKKLGIQVELIRNFPWVYLDKINGVKIKIQFMSEHGYHMYWSPIRPNQQGKFTDISHLFNTIRNVLKMQSEDRSDVGLLHQS